MHFRDVELGFQLKWNITYYSAKFVLDFDAKFSKNTARVYCRKFLMLLYQLLWLKKNIDFFRNFYLVDSDVHYLIHKKHRHAFTIIKKDKIACIFKKYIFNDFFLILIWFFLLFLLYETNLFCTGQDYSISHNLFIFFK